jgi:hypothetical protein
MLYAQEGNYSFFKGGILSIESNDNLKGRQELTPAVWSIFGFFVGVYQFPP